MINVKIITPNGLYKEFETPFLNITSKDGERGILEHHVPVCFMLDIGKLETNENGIDNLYAINGGMFYFEKGNANILVDTIESKEDIDLKRAEASRDRSLNRLEKRDTNLDLKRAEAALKRAMNRIKIATM